MSQDSVGYKIDDSDLFHGTYDPAKAHEYYLKRRKLKGRNAKLTPLTVGRTSNGHTSSGSSFGGKANRSKTKSRQAQLKAQREHLQQRLDHLREVLDRLVKDAQKRSGGSSDKKQGEKEKAPETQADKADRNKDQKKDKPETAAQKKEKAKKAKDEYEKEHPNSLSNDVNILKAQVADIQAKIKQALAADDKRNKAGDKKSEQSGSKNNKNDGPRGR